MTLYEIARFIPLGSQVELYEWDADRRSPDPNKRHQGVLCELHYREDHNTHAITLKDDKCSTRYIARNIAHIQIIQPPRDMGRSAAGVPLEHAAGRMYKTTVEYMKYVDPTKRQSLELVLPVDFGSELDMLCAAVQRARLYTAQELLRAWRRLPTEDWQDLFTQLRDARLRAQSTADPDLPWLRRAEAYICCRARKENFVIYDLEDKDPLAYAIGILVENLVDESAEVLAPESFGTAPVRSEQALDWFLLALCYHRSGMHGSCAYAALVQSILHLGRFFRDHKNRQFFSQLCGSAHDFTLLRYLLESFRSDDAPVDAEVLQPLGHTILWMLYQMGGSGILDADELRPWVEICTQETVGELRERLLGYVMKYAPRNRNDRFIAITRAMKRLLAKMRAEPFPADCGALYGYLYEFHGERGMPVSDYDGFILGQDFLSYRVSYPANTYATLPMRIQALSANAREFGIQSVPAVWFCPAPSGKLYRYQADSNFELENGGYLDDEDE